MNFQFIAYIIIFLCNSLNFFVQVSVPKSGATVFAGLNEVIEDLTPEQRQRWDKLYMASDRRTGPVHPLIYRHPITRKHVSCGCVDTLLLGSTAQLKLFG